MSSINQEFVPYEQAFELKELGFDEPCLSVYDKDSVLQRSLLEYPIINSKNGFHEHWNIITAPLYQQAFRWFRERKLLGLVCPIDDWNSWGYSIQGEDCMSPFFQMVYGEEYKTYEEAQLECLKRLIQEYEQ